MSVIVILILASLAVALVFLAGFFWAVRAGQYDDTSTPSLRVLTEDAGPHPGPLPSEGRGSAMGVASVRTSQAAPAHPTFSLHTPSESNRP